jgi:GNAT superfamily N-acetyltransferase
VNPDRVRLRPASSDDKEFLWQVMEEAMRPHVERAWGAWDEAFQRERFERSTEPATHQVIELDGDPVGCQWVRSHPDARELVRIYLLLGAQNQGIGTMLMRRLLDEARGTRQPLRLRVLKLNPAKDLYLRLGFAITGENETHYQMEIAWPEE